MAEPVTILLPTTEHLCQPYVLAQAWKKSVSYIRRHNWYSDPLELDLSAVDVPEYIEKIQSQLIDGTYKPKPLRLVPAPKSQPSRITKGENDTYVWLPEAKTDSNKTEWDKLRPLAHIALPDQVVCTAIMMCLADSIEAAQHDPSKPYHSVNNPIISYGNRLFCEHLVDDNGDKTARFFWGNASSYRKYFTDYRAYLERPRKACRDAIARGVRVEDIRVASLDISAFFDDIDRDRLIASLRETAVATTGVDDSAFWELVKASFAWAWEESTNPPQGLLKRDLKRAMGIPQGLVASGFLANAYLLDTDIFLRALIGTDIQGARILDVMRYVDDIRIVFALPSEGAEELKVVGDAIVGEIKQHLDEKKTGLKLNKEKTAYQSASEILAEGETSTVMSMVQQTLSGAADHDAVREALTNARFLLAKSVQGNGHDPHGAFADLVINAGTPVKDTTVARFASGKIVQGLHERRLWTPLDKQADGTFPARELDEEFYHQALRFIELWSINPALTIILRRAMALCPAPALLRRVLNILWQYAVPPLRAENAHSWYIAWFTLTDLLYAGATETGFDLPPDGPHPQRTDLAGYRTILVNLASDIIQREDAPWYALQQALLFMAFMNKPIARDVRDRLKPRVDGHHRRIHWIMEGGDSVRRNLRASRRREIVLAFHLVDDHATLIPSIAEGLCNAEGSDRNKILETIWWSSPRIATALVNHVRAVHGDLNKLALPSHLAAFFDPRDPANRDLPMGQTVGLVEVITAPNNPFSHENNLLVLADALLDEDVRDEVLADGIGPQSISIVLEKNHGVDWSDLVLYRGTSNPLKVHLRDGTPKDDRYKAPPWLNESTRTWQYRLGMLLRAAAVGSEDFSQTYTPHHEQIVGRRSYRGLRGDWQRRQIGLLQDPFRISGPASTITSWFGELLMYLLAWPGARIRLDQIPEIESVSKPEGLRKIIRQRRQAQAELYGKASSTPIYREWVDVELDKSKKLTVVLAQTSRPLFEDFENRTPDLSDPAYRKVHANHLSSVLQLIVSHLRARKTLDLSDHAHLIVLPELAVHEDDLPRIARLSHLTQANILCGLVYRHEPRLGGLVNSAAWILRRRSRIGTNLMIRYQGKAHPTDTEKRWGVLGYRPAQIVVDLHSPLLPTPVSLTASICYDATDIQLAADLRNVSDMFIVPAMNKDIATFDHMASAYRFHMFQHVALVNSGQYGGSLLQAPHGESAHQHLMVHNHGGKHIAISIADIDLSVYARAAGQAQPAPGLKTAPAGYARHPR